MTREIKPGEFHGGDDFDSLAEKFFNEANISTNVPLSEEEFYRSAVPSFSDSLIQGYELFRERVYSPKRVLYPSCDLDASPVKGFPDAYVVLVDINENAVNVLKRNGINAMHFDINTYTPEEKFDLAILLNPCIESGIITPFLTDRGYVLANNWHQNARQLAEDNNYESIGTLEKVPKRIDNNRWSFHYDLTLGEMKDLGKVADNFWIFRRKE